MTGLLDSNMNYINKTNYGINTVNSLYNKKENNKTLKNSPARNLLMYGGCAGIGSAIGYSIKLKPLDGHDEVNDLGRLVSKRKTQISHAAGSWRNALIGAFIGILTAFMIDCIRTKKADKANKSSFKVSA